MPENTSEVTQPPSRGGRSRGRIWRALPLLQRPSTLAGRLALIAVNLACVATVLFFPHGHGMAFGPYRVDLDVYRIGGRAWLSGMHLYGPLPATMSGARLPFTYPPLAAVVLSPLAVLPMAVASLVLTLASVGLLALVLRLCLRSLDLDHAGASGGSAGWWAVCWLLPLAIFLEPVRNSLAYGQVNVLLMALVVADCLVPGGRWPRGALVGIAAAIKLTPAGFVLFFLLRRDWRATATAGAAFMVTTGAGFLLSWHDSVQYWTTTVFDASRVGGLTYAANQSIVGVLTRLRLDQPELFITWALVAAALLAAACLGMRRALTGSHDCLALSLNAFAALLISPVSWSHQWVFCVPALLALLAAGVRQRSRVAVAATAAGLAVFASGPQWWFPRGQLRELDWSGWQQAVGSSYAAFAAVILIVTAIGVSGLAMRPSQATVAPAAG